MDYSRLEPTQFTRSRLRELNCVIAGAGALGNEVARVLGLLGAARVVVVDPDVVEASNLPRSIFFHGKPAIGQNKAETLVEAAAALFPDTRWAAVRKEIADVGFQRLRNASLLFSCVDSDLARLEIAYISTKLGIPVADGGLGRQNYSHGRVTYFPGTPNQACYGCMLSSSKRGELLQLWQATLRPCSSETGNPQAELVSTPTMAGIVGCIQAELGLRSFFQANEGKPLGARSLEIQIHPARRMEDFAVPISMDCPFHRYNETLKALPRASATFEELLDSARAEAVVLDWPICIQSKCLDCENEWPPMVRLAALRRSGICPACGSGNILELETIRVIGRDSVWLGRTPSALQLPAEHLYSVQVRAGTL